MNKYVRCCSCKKVFGIMENKYHRLRKIFNVKSEYELSEYFLCQKCHVKHKEKVGFEKIYKYIKNNDISNWPQIKTLQEAIQQEVDCFYLRGGFSNETALRVFNENISKHIDKIHLKKYSFKTDRKGDLIGMMLNEVPLFGDIFIELHGQPTKESILINGNRIDIPKKNRRHD